MFIMFLLFFFFFFNDTATTEIYTLSLHDALPISDHVGRFHALDGTSSASPGLNRSEEHTSELQSRSDLVCRLLLEKKKNNENQTTRTHNILVSIATARAPRSL